MRKKSTSGRTRDGIRRRGPSAIEKAARADRDAQPLTAADFAHMRRTPQAKIIRPALELTQEEFALRYHIPLGTLRGSRRARPADKGIT